MGPLVFALLGLGCIGFAALGLFTTGGQKAFDEMAGMIPVFVGFAGVAFLAIAIVWFLVRLVRED